jgi:hypothetical protein
MGKYAVIPAILAIAVALQGADRAPRGRTVTVELPPQGKVSGPSPEESLPAAPILIIRGLKLHQTEGATILVFADRPPGTDLSSTSKYFLAQGSVVGSPDGVGSSRELTIRIAISPSAQHLLKNKRRVKLTVVAEQDGKLTTPVFQEIYFKGTSKDPSNR